jgi:diguanylate cyclase (GGDEF)-like protein
MDAVKAVMDHDPQIENQYLRRQLQSLLAEARQNEEKMRRFDRLERRLIGTRSLVELIRTLLQDYKAVFDLDAVTLALTDPEYETARILESESKGGADIDNLILLDSPAKLEGIFGGKAAPALGSFNAASHDGLFGTAPRLPASVALLPLMRQGELIGSLNLGSGEAGRFTGDSGTDFLERLSAIVAICLENALNHERLKQVGLTDPLTGINNRRYFDHRCLEEVTHARRHGLPLACMFLDVDKFKNINDTLGHHAGDEVLRDVAAKIKSQLRASDIVARYGGEEFVVLLPQTGSQQALEVAERIRATIASQLFQPLPGQVVPVTISIGLAMLPGDAKEKEAGILAEKLIAAADEALYRAKEGGRNRVVCAA